MTVSLDPASIPVVRVFVEPFRRHDDKGLFFLTAVSFLLFCLGLCFQANGSYDTDGWFLLATGRQIVRHGIPYVNPWSLDPGRPIVVQQWLHDVLLYGSWSALGFTGTVIYQGLMACCVIVAFVFAIRSITGGSLNFRYLMFSIAVGMSGAGLYISVRPTPWSMAAFLVTVGICARYRRSGDHRLLAALPLVSIFHVQMQSAMVGLDIFVAASFLAADILCNLRNHQPSSLPAFIRAEAPLAGAVILMALSTLLNPYGLDGALYVFRGMDAASYGDVISEMKGAFAATGGFAVVFLALYILVPLLLLRGKLLRDGRFPLVIITVAALVATLLHWRNIWILALASSLLTSTSLEVSTDTASSRVSKCVLISMTLFAVLLANVLPAHQTEGRSEWQVVDDALSPIADKLESSDIDHPKVYSVDPFAYNYLEWKGLKVPFDLRPEIWDKTDSDGTVTSPYRDYVDSLGGDKALSDYLRAGNFDYFILPADRISDYRKILPLQKVCISKGYALMRVC